jgi:hypothetical protein
MKARISALIRSAFVVGIPCGNPGYALNVAFFSSFAAFGPEFANGTI